MPSAANNRCAFGIWWTAICSNVTCVAPSARSCRLRADWAVVDQKGVGPTLRLSHDDAGDHLFPTPAEAELEPATPKLRLASRPNAESPRWCRIKPPPGLAGGPPDSN